MSKLDRRQATLVVIDVQEAFRKALPKFDEVKPQIAQQLQQQKIAAFQEDLRKKAKVE